jgi:antitoxin (DNA-binding transcriptional repressor) of toxin-antitoxin stability system
MKTISARTANQGFSALLSRVEAGEEILITKHGRPVAMRLRRRQRLTQAELALTAPLPAPGQASGPSARRPRAATRKSAAVSSASVSPPRAEDGGVFTSYVALQPQD